MLSFPSSRSHTYNSLHRSYGILYDRFQPDTGAEDSDFISARAYSLTPVSHLQLIRHIDISIRLGDAGHLSVQLEVLLHASIADSTGQLHN
jgi:hypothetical protein